MPRGYSGRWGWVYSITLSHPLSVPGTPARRPASGSQVGRPLGGTRRRHTQSERSRTHPRSLPHTPAGSHIPAEAPAPTRERRPPAPAGSPAPGPTAPPVICPPGHGSVNCSSLVACVPPPVPCPQVLCEPQPAPTTGGWGVVDSERCSQWGTCNKLQGALMPVLRPHAGKQGPGGFLFA